ncbi:MAG: Rab family GTPase [Candidatus Kariarchaeaceae archaeon]
MSHQFNPNRRIYKVTLLGDGGVGKTSLRKRYLGEGFKQNYMATIGADFAIKKVSEDGSDIIQIWDLAGQQRFSLVREAYYLGTKGAILTYDITRPDTFYSIPNWIGELMNNIRSEDPLPMALVANKIDLRANSAVGCVSKEQGIQYAKDLAEWAKMDVPYIETSAKTGFNVDKMFATLIQNIQFQDGSAFNL